MAKVLAICISDRKGIQKHPVPEGRLVENHGLEDDAHAGPHHRQVSLLAAESISVMKAKGLDLNHGDFGENIVTEGITLPKLPVGTRMRIGPEALVEVTQIGKECHDHCAIYEKAGDCIMPREGIFVRIIRGGSVNPGDEITVLP